MSECKVKVCHATKCKYNKKKKCQLEFVTISSEGHCMQYDVEGQKPKQDYDDYLSGSKRWQKTLKPEYEDWMQEAPKQ